MGALASTRRAVTARGIATTSVVITLGVVTLVVVAPGAAGKLCRSRRVPTCRRLVIHVCNEEELQKFSNGTGREKFSPQNKMAATTFDHLIASKAIFYLETTNLALKTIANEFRDV